MIPERLRILLDECKWDDALLFIQEQPKPLSDEVTESLAWCYSRTERYSEAIAIYEVLVQKQSENARWHYSLGYQFYAQKNYANAVPHFEKALEFYPLYFKVKYRLSYSYLQLAGTDRPLTKDVYWKAIQQLNDAHKLYDEYSKEDKEKNKATYADICFLHGKTIISLPNYIDKGIEYLYTAIRLKGDNDAKYQLAKAFYNKKDYEQALKELPQETKQPYYVSELKSQIFAESGKVEDAIKIVLNLVRFRKKDYLFQRLSQYYLLIENKNKAEEYALLAINIDKRNYKNYLACGQAYKAMEKFKTAVRYFEQAREKKQKMYNVDCAEALQEIDNIMERTANDPTDLVTTVSVLVEEMANKIRGGRIKDYIDGRGFGFIKENISESEFFFHIKQFEQGKTPQIGMEVSFETEIAEKGERAVNIKIKKGGIV